MDNFNLMHELGKIRQATDKMDGESVTQWAKRTLSMAREMERAWNREHGIAPLDEFIPTTQQERGIGKLARAKERYTR